MLNFSVIVPVEPGRKCEVGDYLKRLKYKGRYEVIIEYGWNSSKNRNKGAKKAKYEILCFLDDDSIIDDDFLDEASRFFSKHKDIDILGGPQLTPKDEDYFPRSCGYVLESYFATYKMSNRYKKGRLNLEADESCLTSAICFVRKRIFERTGGFNTALFPGEDPEFFARAREKGFRIAYDPEIFIYHRRRKNLRDFCYQFFRYGNVRREKEKFSKSNYLVFIVPSLCILYTLFIVPLIFISYWFLLPYAFYLGLVFLFSFYESVKNGDLLSLPLMLVIFPCVHVSYGIGMIASFFKKS